jgi:riboflavin synthase
MFTGIIETVGTLVALEPEGDNVHLTVRSELSHQLRIDQSLSHNGVCLTVVGVEDDTHRVTAIRETLRRSALGRLEPGDPINLERAMQLGARLDGHIVQGHVDTTAIVTDITEEHGSWRFAFHFRPDGQNVLVGKGSICVDGVSLTLAEAGTDRFAVAIIPYTYKHTRFHAYSPGDAVNLEFDLIGKYVQRLVAAGYAPPAG